MTAATITNSERDAAERGVNPKHRHAAAANPAAGRTAAVPNPRDATLTGGRASTPLTGQVRGTGVPVAPARRSDDAPAVLCNITEQSWILHRTHGTFFVGGARMECAPPYAVTQISARTGAIDLGDKRTLEFPISARDIAEDLAREINSDGGESSFFGVFVCEGSEPTDEELNDAHEKLNIFYRSLVAAADRQWERTHQVAFISDLERRAARELRLEKDWSYEPHQQMDCPACGEKLRPNVAVCRVCGAVLNPEKAAQYGLVVAAAPAPSVPSAQPRQ
jgi:hypothetical protein